ncbi:uncharacterized protein PHALS_00059 [Plasmopara halstedii]|uniref:Uncharacterized protein n=1 Tax=Plasmopara halstedii TaxID=4781 RepID=A0A0P1A6X5_PLAHL|nr:uncharacterized protein PHALS_00059 [Plasmopara halstedii]CEG35722.1 hypothetical protein PHALS_00059 [Plasmopara halstedii]|eukprot:XP_024572091.1 hypothetical protein PHALS_00059 [Plasmopara halstedii]
MYVRHESKETCGLAGLATVLALYPYKLNFQTRTKTLPVFPNDDLVDLLNE